MIISRRFGAAVAALVIVCLSAAPAVAQSGARSSEGYVDLARLGNLDELFDDDPVVEVNIEGPLLTLVAEASRYEDPELADMLSTLDGIYVRGYETRSAGFLRIAERTRRMGRELEDAGWSTVVKVSDDEESVHMYMRADERGVNGMVVMMAEQYSDETVFLNIVGDIDPAQIGRIGSKFQIGGLDDI